MFANVSKCFKEFVHWPTAGPWYTVCGFTDESKFQYKLINTMTDECRPHRIALLKGNLRRIRPETDNMHDCVFHHLSEKHCYGIIWEYLWVFGFSELTAFQPLFSNTSVKPWEVQIAG